MNDYAVKLCNKNNPPPSPDVVSSLPVSRCPSSIEFLSINFLSRPSPFSFLSLPAISSFSWSIAVSVWVSVSVSVSVSISVSVHVSVPICRSFSLPLPPTNPRPSPHPTHLPPGLWIRVGSITNASLSTQHKPILGISSVISPFRGRAPRRVARRPRVCVYADIRTYATYFLVNYKRFLDDTPWESRTNM